MGHCEYERLTPQRIARHRTDEVITPLDECFLSCFSWLSERVVVKDTVERPARGVAIISWISVHW
jgi:hypothetical protein